MGSLVGIVANQPKALGGVLDVDSIKQGGPFINLCDAFNIPLQDACFLVGSKVRAAGDHPPRGPDALRGPAAPACRVAANNNIRKGLRRRLPDVRAGPEPGLIVAWRAEIR